MGIANGLLTFRCYRVEGKPPSNFKELYLQEIRRQGFRDIDVSIERLRSVGWVCVDHLLDTEFLEEKFLFHQYIYLTMRSDQLTIPPKLFKAHYTQREREFLKEHPKRGSLSRKVKEELKTKVREEILKKGVLPNSQGYDMVWNLNSEKVFFFSLNRRTNEEFCDLFQKTFGLSLVPEFPLLLALRLPLAKDLEIRQMIEDLEPSSFRHETK